MVTDCILLGWCHTTVLQRYRFGSAMDYLSSCSIQPISNRKYAHFPLLVDHTPNNVCNDPTSYNHSFPFSTFLRDTLQANRPSGSSSENSIEGPRRYLIGGNWKCNGLYDENVARINVFNNAGPIPSNVDVVLCVPYIHIPMVLSMLRDDIEVGAQDCGNNTEDGAFTGQIGAHQLKDIGCTWVIIGHSERREGFGMAGEPEALCAEKCKIAIDKGLKVMFVSRNKQSEERTDRNIPRNGGVLKTNLLFCRFCF
jgi:hypothetical protein